METTTQTQTSTMKGLPEWYSGYSSTCTPTSFGNEQMNPSLNTNNYSNVQTGQFNLPKDNSFGNVQNIQEPTPVPFTTTQTTTTTTTSQVSTTSNDPRIEAAVAQNVAFNSFSQQIVPPTTTSTSSSNQVKPLPNPPAKDSTTSTSTTKKDDSLGPIGPKTGSTNATTTQKETTTKKDDSLGPIGPKAGSTNATSTTQKETATATKDPLVNSSTSSTAVPSTATTKTTTTAATNSNKPVITGSNKKDETAPVPAPKKKSFKEKLHHFTESIKPHHKTKDLSSVHPTDTRTGQPLPSQEDLGKLSAMSQNQPDKNIAKASTTTTTTSNKFVPPKATHEQKLSN